ncbi:MULTISPECIES: DUF5711 family protein [Lachnospiraceae]|jgi:hypothetical protein|uniref:DUF5711 family protein n=1 Tax=Faecalicatena acetigenes TaxID=2981790 RepID=A0ABT2TCW5_9FIRM|nr:MULTISPECIES: DUF5711 family protein [Lachnospiraceae]MCU6748124.1 DUF5711 family protein [Faecalicatena acetigenes]RGT73776.1 hypothetical protein DWX08_05205 [Ruminococcus sp. AF18-22]SCI27204.1 Uncharacterised protein [uncultured Clostridium sp.]
MAQKKKPYLQAVKSPDMEAVKKREKKHRIEKMKKIIVVVGLLILAMIGTFLLLKNKSYQTARTAAEYTQETSDSNRYAVFKDSIIRYNRDGVVLLDHKNEEQWIQPAQFQSPAVDINGETFAVADIGGNTIQVFTQKGLKGEIETNLPIEKMTVSEQGIVGVLLKNENTPMIMAYDATGNILVEHQVTAGNAGYPTALEISDDGMLLAVSYLCVNGTAMQSRVVYYNFGETGKAKADNEVSEEEYADSVIGEIFFMGESRSVVIGDHFFTIYEGTDIPKKKKEIEITQEIKSVFHTDKYVGFILLNKEKSGYEVRLYDKDGKQVMNRGFTGEYSKVKMDGDEVILYEGSKCCIITATGIIKFQGDLKVDAQEISHAWGINRYYVMSANGLRVIYLTK